MSPSITPTLPPLPGCKHTYHLLLYRHSALPGAHLLMPCPGASPDSWTSSRCSGLCFPSRHGETAFPVHFYLLRHLSSPFSLSLPRTSQKADLWLDPERHYKPLKCTHSERTARYHVAICNQSGKRSPVAPALWLSIFRHISCCPGSIANPFGVIYF